VILPCTLAAAARLAGVCRHAQLEPVFKFRISTEILGNDVCMLLFNKKKDILTKGISKRKINITSKILISTMP
jgi:hypothetical protein